VVDGVMVLHSLWRCIGFCSCLTISVPVVHNDCSRSFFSLLLPLYIHRSIAKTSKSLSSLGDFTLTSLIW
jgi:hypothetical protein